MRRLWVWYFILWIGGGLLLGSGIRGQRESTAKQLNEASKPSAYGLEAQARWEARVAEKAAR